MSMDIYLPLEKRNNKHRASLKNKKGKAFLLGTSVYQKNSIILEGSGNIGSVFILTTHFNKSDG